MDSPTTGGSPEGTGSASPAVEARRRRHALAKDLLLAALDLDPDGRAAFLEQSCGGDELLRRDVESLLAVSGDPLPSRAAGLPAGSVAVLEPLAPGTVIASRYRIDALVGEGGMGQVYRAADTLLDETVALKRLRVRGPFHRRRLLEEARLARQVSHPAACRVHDAGEHGDETFLTMEMLEGLPLSQLLEQDGALPSERVAAMARALCEGLAAAHAAGVLHGDLKPANVVVDRRGAPHIVDFGLARALEPSLRHGLQAGSPAYMAPEQLDAEGMVDERTDLHALGLVLHEALTGRRVFSADGAAELLDQVRLLRPPPPSRLVAGVDPALDAAVRALLEKEPSQRPGSAREVLALLMGEAPAQDRPQRRRGGRLPRPLTALVGRAGLVERITALLQDAPVVTVTGPGGCGKTRLATEVARHVDAGGDRDAWFVDLSGLRDGDGIVHETARVLGAKAEGDALAAVVRFLAARRPLLILDNCEHLRDAAARFVAALLEELPGLRVVATSRETPCLPGEQVVAVPPLAVPAPADERDPAALAAVESVALFVERARARHPGFEVDARTAPSVARICRRLDGVPLALELAASLLGTSSIDDVARSLDERLLDLSSRDPLVPERQRTLRGLVEWCHARLGGDAAVLFRRLSVFAGGFTLAKAEQACARAPLRRDDVHRLVAELADRSLLQVQRHGAQVRYRMLETLRAHGAACLADAGEEDAMREEHLRCFVRLALSAREPLEGLHALAWLDRFEPETDNLRAALVFAATSPQRAADGLRLIVALWPFLQARGLAAETRRHLAVLLAAAAEGADAADDIAIAWGCHVAGLAEAGAAALTEGRDLQRRACALARRHGLAGLEALALTGEGQAAADGGDMDGGRALLREACTVARAAGEEAALARALNGLGSLELRAAALEAALAHYSEALEVARRAGRARLEARILASLSIVHMEAGRVAEARPLAERSLELGTRLDGAPSLAVRATLGTMRYVDGDHAGAKTMLQAALTQARDECNAHAASSIAVNLVLTLQVLGENDAAQACLVSALTDALRLGPPRGAVILAEQLARACSAGGRPEHAALLLGATRRERERIRQPHLERELGAWRQLDADVRGALGDGMDGLLREGGSLPLNDAVQRVLGA